MKVIISGGGTGGHVFPAIAIADAIRAEAPGTQFLFVGAKGRIEMEKVPKAGYRIEGLWISGFQRKLTVRNLLFPFKLVHSLLKAQRIIRRFQPDVAIGVGGYASGPTLEMAYRLGVPTLIQEQNSLAGVTNRLLAGKVKKVCVAYPGMERFFPKDKIVLTGNPVRAAIAQSQATAEEGWEYFGLTPEKETILVFGGSLGARSINQAMAKQVEMMQERQDVQVLWQVGKLYFEEYRQHPMAKLENVHVVPFIDRMDLAYAMSDVIIGRAGALTISELGMVGKPVILIPSPNVAEDHQTRNAEALVNQGAAVMIKDQEAEERILREALELLKDKKRARALGEAIRKMARPDAARDIAREVIALVTPNKNS
jgi:UDP-N-acetylglucosamine--N-acetylmuramyl-(pentapeptide) pyrophosphoryl-undecaprenol N-acetylglucosamine transferase